MYCVELKKHRSTSNHKPTLERESSGLDALANAAILGDLEANQGTTSVATTTKHPRHRPGCSCIVCIQPPSGKGKHKPTCTCIVCMTVKRRFKTLMMNKKKRQSEREAEIAQRNQPTWSFRDEAEAESTSKHVSAPLDPSENEVRSANELESKSQRKSAETVKKKLDLNCHPVRAEELLTGSNHISMMRLLEVANRPLETYLKQNGLASLVQEQQTNSSSHKLPQVTNESEGQIDEDHCLVSVAQDQDSEDEEQCEPHHNQNDPPQ